MDLVLGSQKLTRLRFKYWSKRVSAFSLTLITAIGNIINTHYYHSWLKWAQNWQKFVTFEAAAPLKEFDFIR